MTECLLEEDPKLHQFGSLDFLYVLALILDRLGPCRVGKAAVRLDEVTVQMCTKLHARQLAQDANARFVLQDDIRDEQSGARVRFLEQGHKGLSHSIGDAAEGRRPRVPPGRPTVGVTFDVNGDDEGIRRHKESMPRPGKAGNAPYAPSVCGIVGILDYRQPPNIDLARAMAEVLRHRGPDQAGELLDGPCALALRRLAIQDVLHGRQPARTEDGSISVVLNGEIYNFDSLGRDLQKRGHRLASQSDTEVIPHLYEEAGDDFVARLEGMFALALWDGRRRRLLLARDRLGKKPLYYTQRTGDFRFASEIKALFADRSFPREPDMVALRHYLCLQYVPAPWTAFQGVRALPPGSLLVADETGITDRRWWDLPAISHHIPRADAPLLVREAVHGAVRDRMVADVPIGAFLSGGVDSACVVAAMSEVSSKPVRTFTVGFLHSDRDERRNARLTASALGTDHTELVAEPDIVSLLPLMVWHHDQPFADDATMLTYTLARETRRYATVALTGDGGDEAFAGYERVRRLAGWTRSGWLSRLAGRAAARLPVPLDPISRWAYVLRAVGRRGADLGTLYRSGLEVFPFEALPRLLTRQADDVSSEAQSASLVEGALGEGDALRAVQIADYKTYLPGALLPKMDVATMAASVEARSPLLDHRVVELALSLPTEAKIGGGGKTALREAFRGRVPDAVLDGPKRGLGMPLHDWLRGPLAGLATALLASDDSHVRTVVRPAVIDRLLRRHASGVPHGRRLWALMCLEMWFRVFISEPPSLVPPATTTLGALHS